MGCCFTPSSSECELCRSSFSLDSSMHHRGGSSSSDHSVSWVKPGDLKLLYRIGRGQFGDVWLANLCSSSEHRVAVKMLPLIGKDMINTVLRRFDSLLYACQGLKGVNAPLGVSLKNGKICIVSSLYEGSVGGRMAHLPGNRLCLSDVLRFSADIARGVIELHSQGIVSLSLKPCNFLLTSQDEAVVGDYGIPLLFSGCAYLGFKFSLGTPNYMAPEQWNVGTRGPVTYETDSWGFGCCVVEMVTGRKPWEGRSPREIYNLVALSGEKPHIPSGLPVAVHRVLEACFEYDYRNRPDFYDILSALTSPDIVVRRGDWVAVRDESTSRTGIVKSTGEADPSSVLVQFSRKESQALWQDSRGLTLLKDPLQAGDHVRVKQSSRQSTPHEAEGVVLEIDTDEVVARVRFCGCQDIWEGSPDDLEPVSLGIVAGDWVHRSAAEVESDEQEQQQEQQASCIGIVHSVQHNGEVQAAFAGYETLWTGAPSRLARMSPFKVGQTVRLSRRCKTAPRFEWPGKESAGRICRVMPNGCLMLGHPRTPWRREKWWCDPAQVELVRSSSSNLASLVVMSHWYVTPMVIALGLLAGALVGNVILRSNPAAAAAAAAGSSEELELTTAQEEKVFKDESEKESSGRRSWIAKAVNVVAAHLADANDSLLY